ncbi:NAD-dependent epimerase/dehydratase family protein [Nonomuraea sediminis]|uniref:NAD-dependent epimerase/dehydratase family protein n=1 Tax=Nonomuraea sediminis TaxID=2835864 RepID=UPI001BDDC006|nr:NAD-dependent epimerase/dehydratase family protein [Nonomuraea sediminis]
MDGNVQTTYLVTGGAGFIGSHLVEALLRRGDKIIILDNLASGSQGNVPSARDVRFVHGSVLDAAIVDELVRECDVVVHLAAAVGVKMIMEKPLRSLITNIRGTEAVIEAALCHRKKILVASTSEIYGKNASGPLSEDADRILGSPAVVRWSYSTAKAVDEILANAFHRERGLETIVVRLFNTVGPRQSPAYGMVIPRLVHQALRDEELTVYGDGTQTRCFAHVHDVVDALVRLLGEPNAIGQTFNIGSNEEVTILELAKQIGEMCGSNAGVRMVPYHEAYEPGFEDMMRRVPDTSKLRGLTGWVPQRNLRDILTDTISAARQEGSVLAP